MFRGAAFVLTTPRLFLAEKVSDGRAIWEERCEGCRVLKLARGGAWAGLMFRGGREAYREDPIRGLRGGTRVSTRGSTSRRIARAGGSRRGVGEQRRPEIPREIGLRKKGRAPPEIDWRSALQDRVGERGRSPFGGRTPPNRHTAPPPPSRAGFGAAGAPRFWVRTRAERSAAWEGAFGHPRLGGPPPL